MLRKITVNPARSSPLITRDPALNVTRDLGLKDWLKNERESLAGEYFKRGQITTIVASGANTDDIRSLENLGYSRTDIATYLGSGASPSQLQQLVQEGYNWKEIDKIVKATKNCGAKQQASAGSGSNA